MIVGFLVPLLLPLECLECWLIGEILLDLFEIRALFYPLTVDVNLMFLEEAFSKLIWLSLFLWKPPSLVNIGFPGVIIFI